MHGRRDRTCSIQAGCGTSVDSIRSRRAFSILHGRPDRTCSIQAGCGASVDSIWSSRAFRLWRGRRRRQHPHADSRVGSRVDGIDRRAEVARAAAAALTVDESKLLDAERGALGGGHIQGEVGEAGRVQCHPRVAWRRGAEVARSAAATSTVCSCELFLAAVVALRGWRVFGCGV